ncbi:MAG TPA: sigma-70 family RNA polymerase sigma factor, partial [Pseudonocardiaceae bacterium]|nr:sigma-70 family RNA polymerase sigma factor [Pseudonocardiaceae bacterium]
MIPPYTARAVVSAGGCDASDSAPHNTDCHCDAPRWSWELLAASQAGDRDAFAQLYSRYRPTIQRFVRWRVPDWAEAEDLTSETFLRALRRIDTASYQGRDQVRDVAAWLVTIARNLIINRAGSARVRLAHQFGEIPPDHAAPQAGPEELALAAS